MVKKFLRRMILPMLLSANLCALNIYEVKHDGSDNTATMSLCGAFKIENISLEETPFGEVVVMPRELGGYKNLVVTSKEFDGKIKTCFKAGCGVVSCARSPVYKLLEARGLKKSGSVLATVSFDDQLTVIFFVSKHKRGGREIYKVNTPRDFKFTDNKYRKDFREFLIKETKRLL
jgi:hypothetical protein